MDVARFRKLPVLGIVRGVPRDTITHLVEAVIRAGLETIEITMNSAEAGDLIRMAVKASRGRIMIGAGTVLSMDILREALDAGASFVVTPTLIEEVTEYCAKNVVPVFPGALTPQEIYNAWNAGATMVKVFPAAVFGPGYIKEVKAPFDKIELLACGGVTPENIKVYFSSGASAVAFGASVFRKEWLDRKDFPSIEKAIRNLIANAT